MTAVKRCGAVGSWAAAFLQNYYKGIIGQGKTGLFRVYTEINKVVDQSSKEKDTLSYFLEDKYRNSSF